MKTYKPLVLSLLAVVSLFLAALTYPYSRPLATYQPKSVDALIKTSLSVSITGLKKQKGQVYFLLFDQEEGFPKEVAKAKLVGKVPAKGTSVSYTFEGVPYGQYAVAVFHDENSNGEIDTNFIGFPKEKVGASNMKGLGKPNFRKCAIDLNQPSQSLALTFIN